MRTIRDIVCFVIFTAILGAGAVLADDFSRTGPGPVKVFLLIGQSNMNGRGHIDTLKDKVIKELRKDLAAPNLPFVVGVVDVGGKEAKGGQAAVREAQTTIADEPEFKGKVAAVQTWPFWDESKHGEGGYHYNGSARFYIEAGEAFGEAMLDLLKK